MRQKKNNMERQTEPLGLREKILIAAAAVSFTGLLGWSLYDVPQKTDEEKWETYVARQTTLAESPPEEPQPNIRDILKYAFKWTQHRAGKSASFESYKYICNSVEPGQNYKGEIHVMLLPEGRRTKIGSRSLGLLDDNFLDSLFDFGIGLGPNYTLIAIGSSKDIPLRHRFVQEEAKLQDGEALIEAYRSQGGTKLILIIGNTEDDRRRGIEAINYYHEDKYNLKGHRIKVEGTTLSNIDTKVIE